MVGIERVVPSTSHSKSTAYGIADVLNIRLLRFMSSLTPTDFFYTGGSKGNCVFEEFSIEPEQLKPAPKDSCKIEELQTIDVIKPL
jgi:hypothetical protein